jgi:serine/threonine protein kinase
LKDPGPPTHIGRYEIRKELGRGMMGVVYEAHDPTLGRTIALKTIQVPMAASKREREDYERRFLAEARIAARLSHPGIVVVHDVARDGEHGILYIALEYLHGRTLAEVVAEGPLDWRETLRIVGRVAEALRYAHAQGVVHRDIKPANIMLVASGEPKIMDFGIAKLEAAQLTSTGQFFGTPLYMSPEQALGETVDARTDLFSLGSVAYMLLAGRAPFEASSVPGILARVAYQHPRPLREAVSGLPGDVDYVVMRAMAKKAADRYPEARVLAEDVEDILAGRPPRHREGWTPPPTGEGTLASGPGDLPELALESADQRRPPRRRRRPALRLVLLLAGVAAVYFYLHPADRRFWRVLAGDVWRAPLVQELAGWWPAFVSRPPAPVPPPPRSPPSLAPTAAVAAPAALARGPLGEPIEPRLTPGPVPTPAAPAVDRPGAAAGAPPSATADSAGTLAIEFEHRLREGNLKVWVDGASVVDEDFDGRVTRKILGLTLRKGVVQQQLALSPGRHEVKVEVRWDDNVKSARTSGTFKPGATRRLQVQVGRIRGNLSLDWK